MGRKSREKREKRAQRARAAVNQCQGATTGDTANPRIRELEEELRGLADGDAVFHRAAQCPDDAWESGLKDVLAFESVATGTSLFDGLQEHGIDLPAPGKLDSEQCAEKAKEVMLALADMHIFLCGFERMAARELYETLWNQTLWEGCYVENRNPGAVTLIDVSHKMPRSEIRKCLDELSRMGTVH